MVCMSGNDEFPSGNLGDCSQLTDCILDSEATCHMTIEVTDFTQGLLEDTDTNIGVADRHHITTKQKGQLQIKCATITDIFLLQRYTTYFLHYIYSTKLFQLLRY